jgi:hypothetical protein
LALWTKEKTGAFPAMLKGDGSRQGLTGDAVDDAARPDLCPPQECRNFFAKAGYAT